MRRVLLQRPAFLDNALCARGSIVNVPDNAPLADYMTLMPDVPVSTDKIVTVHAHTHEVDIDADGVTMRFDHAALKIENT